MSGSDLYRAAAACLAWFGLALQFLVVVEYAAPPAPWIATLNFFSYFTILTNIASALALTCALAPGERGLIGFFKRPATRAAVTLYILVVCAVYHVVLRQTWNPQGWQRVADNILHYAVPLVMLVDFALLTPKASLRFQYVAPWLIYPLAYGCYALARGALSGFYPYPFLDVAALGIGQVLINLGVLLAGLAVAGVALIAIAKAASRRSGL